MGCFESGQKMFIPATSIYSGEPPFFCDAFIVLCCLFGYNNIVRPLMLLVVLAGFPFFRRPPFVDVLSANDRLCGRFHIFIFLPNLAYVVLLKMLL